MSTTLTSAPAGAGKTGQDDDQAGRKKGKRKLVLALLLVVIGAAAAWFFLLRGNGSAAAEPKKPEKGAVLVVEPVSINLAEGRYLKLGFALQLTKDVKEQPDPSEALAIAIDQFSGQSMEKLSKPEERRRAIEALTKAVEKAYENEVMDLYPTTLVMQ